MLFTLFKFIIFMFSNLGYWSFFRNKYKINLYFLPIFTIAFQFLFLFAGGLLNLLQEVTVLLHLLGLCFLLQTFRMDKFSFLKPYLNWGYGFLILGIFILTVAVRDAVFVHFDNFSHWAIVVKKMLETDRFPNFTDQVICFQNYPLGSSSYIYYFCKLTGTGEDFQMLAQAYMMLCCLLPLFLFVQKTKFVSTTFIVLMTNFLLCYNITIYDLLVDTLLPLAGMATILFVFLTYVHPCDEPVSVLCAIPLLFWTAQIKNSGLLFSFAAAGLLLFSLKEHNRQPTKTLAVCISPLIGYFIWNRHCDYVFAQASFSKHAMTADNFSSIFSQKSTEDIVKIAKGVLEYAIHRDGLRWFLVWLIVLGIVTFLFRKSNSNLYCKLLACTLGMYIIYLLGIGAMYIFSMPVEEAITLASIERYLQTLDIALYYLMVLYAISLISSLDKHFLSIFASIILLILLVFNWNSATGLSTVFQQPSSSSRMAFETTIQEYGLPEGESYYICLPETDLGYYFFLCSYFLDTQPNWGIISEESQLEVISNYNILINFDTENPFLQNWLAKNYPDQQNETVIYMFS